MSALGVNRPKGVTVLPSGTHYSLDSKFRHIPALRINATLRGVENASEDLESVFHHSLNFFQQDLVSAIQALTNRTDDHRRMPFASSCFIPVADGAANVMTSGWAKVGVNGGARLNEVVRDLTNGLDTDLTWRFGRCLEDSNLISALGLPEGAGFDPLEDLCIIDSEEFRRYCCADQSDPLVHERLRM